LSLGKSLRGCPGEPPRGFRIIGPYAFTIHVGYADKVLRDLKSLVCGLAIPCDRLRRISLHTPSVGVHESDIELGARIALLSKWSTAVEAQSRNRPFGPRRRHR
jgi:hypothetical protein